ncbi:MAG: hypothetical protein QXH07_03245 [Thermoplasmata archaeon]
MKSAGENLYSSSQIDASLSRNTISEKLRIIGSDIAAQTEFFLSITRKEDRILFDLSSIFSRSENINLVRRAIIRSISILIRSTSLLYSPGSFMCL